MVKAYTTGEMSSNAGGLIRWPVFALVPVGFALLGLQGVSELIKRIAFLQGLMRRPDREEARPRRPRKNSPKPSIAQEPQARSRQPERK